MCMVYWKMKKAYAYILDKAIWEVMCFKATYRGYKMYKEVYLAKIYLLGHFIRSMPSNKVALKTWTSLIALSTLYSLNVFIYDGQKIHTTSQKNIENNQNEWDNSFFSDRVDSQ